MRIHTHTNIHIERCSDGNAYTPRRNGQTSVLILGSTPWIRDIRNQILTTVTREKQKQPKRKEKNKTLKLNLTKEHKQGLRKINNILHCELSSETWHHHH
jgi:hypothetical protein